MPSSHPVTIRDVSTTIVTVKISKNCVLFTERLLCALFLSNVHVRVGLYNTTVIMSIIITQVATYTLLEGFPNPAEHHTRIRR